MAHGPILLGPVTGPRPGHGGGGGPLGREGHGRREREALAEGFWEKGCHEPSWKGSLRLGPEAEAGK